ncbi:PEP-CTERM sorting domain-containing protein [Rivularia sp. UHCC 0363]|uniref:PEP-CTERM sorting domain-containing protein n=1 Tax=Rivularia sp. UHCC 0363 TaxID=3110244 RepID=UPI002B1FABD5|nr:PEP-CTERM sorting domain-containing protein [Rivularia sp. UHCC 0363]MEA5596043.1 PEP-CTERM sorting domain-containing protein [Rivularia sp. UHCC 0363]
MSIPTILKRISIAAAGAATIALTATSAASAASISFDFAGSLEGPKESFIFDKDDLNVTATGILNNGTSRNVIRSQNGLGVNEGVGERQEIDGDALGKKETLNLGFNKLVKLLSATFTKVDTNDDFKLFVDGTQLVAAAIPGGNVTDTGVGTFDFSSLNAKGTVLGFSVGEDTGNEYFLKAVEVQEVPEPTTILGSLLVSGFGAMFYKKRKNQSDVTA